MTAYTITSDVVRSESKSLFFQQANSIEKFIESRFNLYTTIIYGIKGFFEGSEEVTADEWSAYIRQLDLKNRYPGINSVAFARLQPAEDQDKYLVTYIEPSDRVSALGFDLTSEGKRLTALNRSLETNHIALTDQIFLAADNQPGFLMLIPIFKEREVTGVAIITFNSLLIFKNVYGQDDSFPNLNFKLYRGEKMDEDRLLYDHDPAHSLLDNNYWPKFETTGQFSINGETLTLHIATKPDFKLNPSAERLPAIVLISGLTFSFLFLGIFIYKLR